MKLYMIRDGESSTWVVAETYGDAVEQWRSAVGMDVGSEPDEVTLVSEDVLLP